jgi:hypothetical protein
VKIYLVIIQDRHVDIDIRLFRTLDEAVDFARNEVEERYWHHESVEWDRWDKIDRDSDYHWSVGYSSESDRVSVISRDLPS